MMRFSIFFSLLYPVLIPLSQSHAKDDCYSNFKNAFAETTAQSVADPQNSIILNALEARGNALDSLLLDGRREQIAQMEGAMEAKDAEALAKIISSSDEASLADLTLALAQGAVFFSKMPQKFSFKEKLKEKVEGFVYGLIAVAASYWVIGPITGVSVEICRECLGADPFAFGEMAQVGQYVMGSLATIKVIQRLLNNQATKVSFKRTVRGLIQRGDRIGLRDYLRNPDRLESLELGLVSP